jgi:hypothetical protein
MQNLSLILLEGQEIVFFARREGSKAEGVFQYRPFGKQQWYSLSPFAFDFTRVPHTFLQKSICGYMVKR